MSAAKIHNFQQSKFNVKRFNVSFESRTKREVTRESFRTYVLQKDHFYLN